MRTHQTHEDDSSSLAVLPLRLSPKPLGPFRAGRAAAARWERARADFGARGDPAGSSRRSWCSRAARWSSPTRHVSLRPSNRARRPPEPARSPMLCLVLDPVRPEACIPRVSPSPRLAPISPSPPPLPSRAPPQGPLPPILPHTFRLGAPHASRACGARAGSTISTQLLMYGNISSGTH